MALAWLDILGSWYTLLLSTKSKVWAEVKMSLAHFSCISLFKKSKKGNSVNELVSVVAFFSYCWKGQFQHFQDPFNVSSYPQVRSYSQEALAVLKI